MKQETVRNTKENIQTLLIALVCTGLVLSLNSRCSKPADKTSETNKIEKSVENVKNAKTIYFNNNLNQKIR